uniref:Immune mapped protein 2 N-terminal domain-containing protein n=1 Tax=Arcella intermedia TaxID=1963864 RepID=A0A6B2LNU8_9EUKA
MFYESTSQGTLFSWWSQEPIQNALAYFKPNKPVSAFKFKDKGGKNEIIRGCSGPGIKNYYTGWCQFLKLAQSFEGDFQLLQSDGEHSPSLYLNLANTAVQKLEAGQAVGTKEAVAGAAASRASSTYNGVKNMAPGVFVSAATNEREASLLFKK